ncbi:ABC transporter substrate-binding protein [Formosa sp. A9]|uniref:ABC transporter substrate-binding protein n=1 Tax=Formosa sp. A9 TaxID=3442641 RepID=UPI003EC14A10
MHHNKRLLNKTFFIHFVCILGILLCNGCKSEPKKDNSHLVFRYNEHKNISSLDPAFSKDLADISATNQLFNGLVQMNDSMQVLPAIAKSWTISEDGLHYSFNLRNDVFFHKHRLFKNDSTRRVVASDFEYSLKRLLNPTVGSPGRWVLNKVDGFKAINDSTFNITLKQAFPAFLGLLTMKYCSVVPREIVSFYGSDFRNHPIGTGPFYCKRWEENIKLVFRKNKHYFEKDATGTSLPYLEAIAITFLPDKQSEFLQFAQGNIDFISGLDASYKDDILTAKGELRAKYTSSVNMLRAPFLNTEYLSFYMDSEIPEIQSEKIRKALNYGFDRKKMMTYLRNGIGIPARGGFIPKGLPGYNPNIGYTYQPEKAKALIAEFISETGIQTPEITITTTSNYLSFCEYIQREIQKTGIVANINVIPASALKDAKANGKLDMFRASWVADYPDAENYLSLFYSKNFAPNGPNYSHFKNNLFDQWYEQAFTTNHLETRTKLYTKMDSLVLNHAPIVPLFYDEVVRFTGKNVSGLGINPTNLLELKHVKKQRE